MRWYAFLAGPNSTATPQGSGEWDALDLPGGARLILAKYHNIGLARQWAQVEPGVIFLPRRARLLPPAIVTALAGYGVVVGDTVDDALEKISAGWPHPGIFDHY